MRSMMFLFVFTAAMSVSTSAKSFAERIPHFLSSKVPRAEMIGSGRYQYLFWDVYDAALYGPEGDWNERSAYALTLTYHRSLGGKNIADRSIQEIRKQGTSDEITLAGWHEQLKNIFPDVREGDSLTGIRLKQGETVFYHNKNRVGKIKDPAFSDCFFDIWLGESTSAPGLRKQLLAIE